MIRKRAQFAGSWYPSDAGQCRREIEMFLKGLENLPRAGVSCGIVPHAGWFFSGALACRVMASLAEKKSPDLVLIFGMHMHENQSPRILSRGGWETPLGNLDVHDDFVRELAIRVNVQLDTPEAFPGDNTIEVQLPLVKYFFPKACMVPVGVPPCPVAEKIGEAAVGAARHLGIDMVVVGSTDLTHYGEDFGFAPAGIGIKAREWMEKKNDAAAMDAMRAMDVNEILFQGRQRRNMCCAGAVAATVAAARALGAIKGNVLGYANSFDKSPGTSMVGYTGVLFG